MKKEITQLIFNQRVYHIQNYSDSMFYQFELQLAGIILLTAMAVGGITLWLKRRRDQQKIKEAESEEKNL